MLLEAENVHRPKLDMHHLQKEYGQDIVDFLLDSTCTHSVSPDNVMRNVVVRACSLSVVGGLTNTHRPS